MRRGHLLVELLDVTQILGRISSHVLKSPTSEYKHHVWPLMPCAKTENDGELPGLARSTEHKFNFVHLTWFSSVGKLKPPNSLSVVPDSSSFKVINHPDHLTKLYINLSLQENLISLQNIFMKFKNTFNN